MAATLISLLLHTTPGILRSGGGFAISLKQQVKLGFANSRSFERQATI